MAVAAPRRPRTPYGEVFATDARYRRELARADRAALRRLVAAFRSSDQAIQQRLVVFAEKILAAQAAGEPVGPSWVFQAQRLAVMQAQATVEWQAYARILRSVLAGSIDEALTLGLLHAEGRALAMLGSSAATASVGWASVPAAAIRHAVGFQSGGPLRRLLDSFGEQEGQRVGDAIVEHLATGQGPRALARVVKRATGETLQRSLTIARTETLRAYREAHRQAFSANPRIVSGWVWQSACDRRTCAACWAQNGTQHSADESLAAHPNCRCTMLPLTRSWSEILGPAGDSIPDTRVDVPSGESLFRRLSPAEQEAILGPGRYALWVEGRLRFSDLARVRRSAEWGDTLGITPIRDLRRRVP